MFTFLLRFVVTPSRVCLVTFALLIVYFVLPVARYGFSDIKVVMVFLPTPLLRKKVRPLVTEEANVRFDPFQATPVFAGNGVPPMCSEQ